jgi:hypothetical protein
MRKSEILTKKEPKDGGWKAFPSRYPNIYMWLFGYIRIYQGPREVSSVSRSSVLEINLNLHPKVIFKCNNCTLSLITMARLTVLTQLVLYDRQCLWKICGDTCTRVLYYPLRGPFSYLFIKWLYVLYCVNSKLLAIVKKILVKLYSENILQLMEKGSGIITQLSNLTARTIILTSDDIWSA